MIPDDAISSPLTTCQRISTTWNCHGNDSRMLTEGEEGVSTSNPSGPLRCPPPPVSCPGWGLRRRRRRRCQHPVKFSSAKTIRRKQRRGSKAEVIRGRSKIEQSRDTRRIGGVDLAAEASRHDVIASPSLTSSSSSSVSYVINDNVALLCNLRRHLLRPFPPAAPSSPSPSAALLTPDGGSSPSSSSSSSSSLHRVPPSGVVVEAPPSSPPSPPPSSLSAECFVGRRPVLRLADIPVPFDPREWSRLDVRTWLEHVRHVYNIRDLDLDRFPMNGKGLCLLSKEMFLFRVPCGGVSLYLDFQLRFRRTLGIR